MTEKYIERLY